MSSWAPLPPPPFSLALYERRNLSQTRIGGGGLLGARIRKAVTRIGRGYTNDRNFYALRVARPVFRDGLRGAWTRKEDGETAEVETGVSAGWLLREKWGTEVGRVIFGRDGTGGS